MAQININDEQLLTVREAAARIPGRGKANTLHPSTIVRWATRGVGGVKLETVRIGGMLYTSTEAISRFVAAANNHSTHTDSPKPARSKPRHVRTRLNKAGL